MSRFDAIISTLETLHTLHRLCGIFGTDRPETLHRLHRSCSLSELMGR